MEEVRNIKDKLICCIDKRHKLVVIVIKGCKTTIQFLSNNEVIIKNALSVA